MVRFLFRLLVLLAMAAAATAAVVLAWTAIGGRPLPVHGLIALSMGVLGTVGLTWGLMALAFKSSREGWDDQSRDGSADAPDDADKP